MEAKKDETSSSGFGARDVDDPQARRACFRTNSISDICHAQLGVDSDLAGEDRVVRALCRVSSPLPHPIAGVYIRVDLF